MSQRLKLFSQGVRTSINRHALKKSDWICENFKHPRNDRIPWSFKDHEFQIEIIDQESPDKCVKKCAQVGVSELAIRESLAWNAMMDFRKMAYVLPTAKFSSEFSSTRFDPAIESCDYIKQMMSKEVDNTGVKKIGTCFLVMRGTSGTNAAISVDLDYVLVDERNFCNQEVLGQFASRLQHSDLKMTTDFSTPTLPAYGISLLYDQSSKARYRVRHSRCEKWVAPTFFGDVRIPGFDQPMNTFTKDDKFHPGIKDAYVNCPHCNNPIPWSDFCDPSRRAWVHEFPNMDKKGYQVMPYDVPKYNTLPDVLGSIDRYKMHSDWVNFRLGSDHTSSEDSFLEDAFDRSTLKTPGTKLAAMGNSIYRRVFIGCDLGKTSWVVIGVATEQGLMIVCAESVEVKDLDDTGMSGYLLRLFRNLLGVRVVVDAMPNYETAMYLSRNLYEGQAFGAYYGNGSKSDLDIYNFKPADGIVTMDRNGSFDDLVKACNGNKIVWCPGPEHKVVKTHLTAIKKVKKVTAKGDIMHWESTGPDHYGHALNYCYAAYQSVENRFVRKTGGAGVHVGKVKLKERADA